MSDVGRWAVAAQSPDRTAVIGPDGTVVPYAELAARAGRIGRVTPGRELAAELSACPGGRIARFRLPGTTGYVAQLPRDPGGKPHKRRLRDPCWSARDRAIQKRLSPNEWWYLGPLDVCPGGADAR